MDAGRKNNRSRWRAWWTVSAASVVLIASAPLSAAWPADSAREASAFPIPAPAESSLSNIALWVGVIGAAGLLVLWLKAARGRRGNGGGAGTELVVLARLPVAPRQAILLLRCGSRQVLVGVSPQTITALGEWAGESPLSGVPATVQRATLQAVAERLGIPHPPGENRFQEIFAPDPTPTATKPETVAYGSEAFDPLSTASRATRPPRKPEVGA